MTPGEIALIAQVLALVTQAITAAVKARQDLGANASATEQTNLATAHTNFQSVIAAAQTALNTTA
jgi:hypothetical protein